MNFQGIAANSIHHKGSKSCKSDIMFLVTAFFSRLWVSSSYFFIENPPSHIDTFVRLKLL